MEEGKPGTRGVIRAQIRYKDIVLGRTNPGLNAQGGFTPATGASPKCDNPRTREYNALMLSEGAVLTGQARPLCHRARVWESRGEKRNSPGPLLSHAIRGEN
jgi:hypothetical protein